MFRDHSSNNIGSFKNGCCNMHWKFNPEVDVNINIKLFSESLNELYCKCFPLKIKYVSPNRLKKPWLTSAILKSIKMKSVYFKMYKRNELSTAYYKRYRNLLTETIRNAKSNYQKSCLLYTSDAADE